MITLQTPQISFELSEAEDFSLAAARRFGLRRSDIVRWSFFRRSLDVRHKHPRFQAILRIEVSEDDSQLIAHLRQCGCTAPLPQAELPAFKPISAPPRVCIVGAGPSGLFAALTLAAAGIPADIFEQGCPVAARARDISDLIHRSHLHPESNICFGEGGAGTYSDGKLMTRTKAREIPIILQWFAQFGAPQAILYESHPHIGTDRLMHILTAMRTYLEAHRITYRFSTRIDGLIIENGRCCGIIADGERLKYDDVFLCPGHSADDLYHSLLASGIAMEPKPLAVGLRIEHPQALLNDIQYGRYAGHPLLPAAEYAVRFNHETLPSAYSFCMCPGGRVVASQTTEDTRVVNGMSGSLRNGRFGNAAIVVQADGSLFPPGPLGGLDWVRSLERRAAQNMPPAFAPAQPLMDFLHHRPPQHNPKTTYAPGTAPADLRSILPETITASLDAAFPVFDRQMRGFITEQAVLIGIESRTSSPVRILRGSDFVSVSTPHLWPLGEGAGYAGGITSCALDGIHAALTWIGMHGGIVP